MTFMFTKLTSCQDNDIISMFQHAFDCVEHSNTAMCLLSGAVSARGLSQ